ncbi:MAG: hypothetical protein D3916_12305 [Candidatus Electrothrix sp. MAN1_4]|nr:hypothetical protein [Candidatus Electrothrix sp. MAN1_4]
MYFRIDFLLTDTAGNKLSRLGTKIKDNDFIVIFIVFVIVMHGNAVFLRDDVRARRTVPLRNLTES